MGIAKKDSEVMKEMRGWNSR